MFYISGIAQVVRTMAVVCWWFLVGAGPGGSFQTAVSVRFMASTHWGNGDGNLRHDGVLGPIFSEKRAGKWIKMVWECLGYF